MLHIADGSCRADYLSERGIPGTIGIYGDLLYEGPIPAGVSRNEFIRARAQFIADGGYTDYGSALSYYRIHEATLESSAGFDETVLWMDHRLSNQLMLIRMLDWLAQHREVRVSMMVDPEADLAVRQPITAAQIDLGARAWSAFASQDPTTIQSLLAEDTTALPNLAAALRRQLEEFPSSIDGLSRTERQAVQMLQARGPLTREQLFVATQKLEDPVFMGDESFYRILRNLVDQPRSNSIVRVSGTPPKYFVNAV